MAYYGYITTLKDVRKHENANKLQVATVFGNDVVIGLDMKIGDKVLYLPTDGQLDYDFAKANNLLRIKDENGKNVGYLDPDKRNIKSIRLRGEKSDGIIMKIDSLSPYTDVGKLKDGDKIDTLNGVLLFQKYIPKAKNKIDTTIKTKKKKKEVKFPFFEEHVDTQQLAYNLRSFKEGDLCYITLKMHGCFTYDTKVKLWNGKRKNISKIEKGDIVIGYDGNKFIPTKVVNTFINGKTNDWLNLKISRNGLAGEKYSNIKCTPNHKFYINETNSYVEARNLNVGDKIHIIKESKELTKEQKEIMTGMYLGDSYFLSKNKSGELQFSYKKDDEDYLNYCINSIGRDIAYKVKKEYLSGFGTEMVRGKTKRLPSINNFFKTILSNDEENKLDENIINVFSEKSLAFLYMDDGSLAHNDMQEDRALVAICDYNDHDAKIIVKCFNKLELNVSLYKDNKGYNRLRLNTNDAYRMFDMIYKYMPKSMYRKLPESYHNKLSDKYYEFDNKVTDSFDFIESEILGKNEFISERGLSKYDIETETHNYVVGNSLVHNSSGRTGHLQKKEPNNWLRKMLRMKTKKSWDFVSGTRRVVLDSFNQEGYYGDNNFRKQWHDLLAEKLPKSCECFYEIVGYTDDGKLIMPEVSNKKLNDKEFVKQYGETTQFTYGCGYGQSEMYIYRMTYTNEDGEVIEIPFEHVMNFCEMNGLNHVPLLDKFIFTTEEDLIERVHKYEDGQDPIGKTHVREGVVVRVENKNPKFQAYKQKNFSFKVLEGIIKDDGVLDIEEEQSLVEEQGE